MQGTPYATCPFCNYKAVAARNDLLAFNDITYHIEVQHPEDERQESPFLLRPPSSGHVKASGSMENRHTEDGSHLSNHFTGESRVFSQEGSDDYTECPQHCGELLPSVELERHLALHDADEVASHELGSRRLSQNNSVEDNAWTKAKQSLAESSNGHGHRSNKKRIVQMFSKPEGKNDTGSSSIPMKTGQRLGKKELGPYAYEDRMPDWLFRQLEIGPPVTWINQLGPDGKVHRVERVANETTGLMDSIARLCGQDRKVSKAWLCSAGVKHIFKMRREGGFCGYRNIQMLVSWMQHKGHPGHCHFPGLTPNIFQLQEMIEDAWDKGFNPMGRIETGGIVGTRKFIGTPEAQALFQSLSIDCHTMAVTKTTSLDSEMPVYKVLMEHVLRYFAQGVRNPSDKIYQTDLPPLYFQHSGHSLTIVGLEVHKDTSVNLLVFDPMFATASAMIRYLGSNAATSRPERVLKSFRRGKEYLEKYRSFELLGLTKLRTDAADAAAA